MQKANKLQRTISIHNLDCLVFEKRQRKQASQFTLNSLQTNPEKKKKISKPSHKHKKILEKVNIKKGQISHRHKTQKSEKQDKIKQEPKKKLGRPRKTQEIKQISTQTKQKDIIQPCKNTQLQAIFDHHKDQSVAPKVMLQNPIVDQRQISKQKNQQISDKIEVQNQNNQQPQIHILQQQISEEIQSSESKEKNPIDQSNQAQFQNLKLSQQQNISDQEDIENDEEQQDNDIHQKEEQESSQSDEQSQKLDKKLIPAPLRKILTQEQKQNKQQQFPSNQKSKQSSEDFNLIRRSTRNVNKKVEGRGPQYQDFNQYSDCSMVKNQKRRYRAKQQECYNLNRIFRKNNKVEQPNFNIQLDLSQVSISSVVNSMPKFEIVHCSLPLSMLIQLPEISLILHKGFIFIWAQKGQIQMGYHLLNRWGFDVIDQIMWIKSNQTQYTLIYDQVQNNQNNENKQINSLFLNCRSTCLVGYKCPANQKVDYCTKISNNVIFAEDSFNKPEQIYEIAELMMPGSRRLEIGNEVQGARGWFVLKHIETSFTRCKLCFRNSSKLNLLSNKMNQIEVNCQKCFKKKTKNFSEQNNTFQNIKAWKMQLVVNKKSSKYFNCTKCSQQTPCRNLIRVQKSLYCKKCFPTNISCTTDLVIQFPPKIFYEFKSISCYGCSKKLLNLAYFQCGTCKAHNLCQQCFWTQQQDISHDWKLRPIVTVPEMKILCFNCQSQCALPYWGCETCIDWFWCGSCQMVKQYQSYAHYGANHNLALIV